MATSWSTLHTARTLQPPSYHPPPKSLKSRTTPKAAIPILTMSMSHQADPVMLKDPSGSMSISSSRASSLAGRKRPRESDGATDKPRSARRTKSVGDAKDGRLPKDREAFQRGLIAVFVPKALQESVQGKTGPYNDLLAHFLPTPTNPNPPLAPLLPLLRAIAAHVSLIVPEVHAGLVSAIVSLPWATADERFVKTYIGWAGVLVSAHPYWAKEVVGMAVKGLAWQTPIATPAAVSRRIYHARHHLLLSHLLSLVPTLPNVLGPLLVRHFPHKREEEVSQTTWVRNLCELIGYCPELGARVWGEIVDRMLRIDAEITNSLEEDDDDQDDDEDEDVAGPSQARRSLPDPFDLLVSQEMPKPADENGDDSDDDSELDVDELSSDEDDEEEHGEVEDLNKAAEMREKKSAAVRLMKQKLDGMLSEFFRHLEEYMGDKERKPTAAEMAAENMAETGNSSGNSTPTSEYAPPVPTSIPSLTTRRPSPSPAQSLAHFQTLLNLFTRQILPTSSTQHIPFLLFLCSSFSPSHTDLFLGLLVSQALYATTTATPSAASQVVPMNQRIAATVYIGSVVCRARFVTDDSARQVIAYLLAYIDGKLRQGGSIKQIDELPLFYAVCQAVMLIFCFRWRAFTIDKESESILGEMELESDGEGEESTTGDGKWMRDLDVLQRAITSDLNPLLGCNPTVVSTFAKVAHHTNFAYCFSIIEANQQAHARSGSSHSLSQQAAQPNGTGSGDSIRQPSRQNSSISPSHTVPKRARQSNIDAGLDSYFPFDPYDLPRSKKYVEGIYRTWNEVSVPFGDEDEDEEEDDSDEEAEDSDSGSDMEDGNKLSIPSSGLSLPKSKPGSYSDARRRLLSKDEGLSSSLEGMSISPGLSGYMKSR